jgi:hypothetical protein
MGHLDPHRFWRLVYMYNAASVNFVGSGVAEGVQHDTYNYQTLRGFALGFALNAGRIARENAAKYMLSK